MFGSGWRYVLAAVVGLTLLAASPPQGEGQQKQNDAYQTPRGGEPVPPWPAQQPDEANEEKKPCEPGDDDRKSDLCAQWKAADSAGDSARWTRLTFYLGLFGALIGFGTLVAAIAAAKYARDAAAHTKAGVDIAGTALATSNRPWIKIESLVVSDAITPFPADDGTVGIGTVVQVAFKNIGDAVALNVGYEVWMLAAPFGWAQGGDLASLHAAKCKEFGRILGRRALFPDESFCEFDEPRTGKVVGVDGETVRRATMPLPDRSEIALIIGGIVTYNIAADDVVHRTSFHYALGYRDEHTAIPISPAPIPAENIRVFQGHTHVGTEPARYVN